MIPSTLKGLQCWFLWKWAEKTVAPGAPPEKFKMPVQPNGKAASSTGRETWHLYDKAAHALEGAPEVFAGLAIGTGRFGLLNAWGLWVIDLDNCIEADGSIKPWASDILDRVRSYTEFSPRGKGLHILVRGDERMVDALKLNLSATEHIEMYSHSRYMTFSGRHLKGTPDDLVDCTEAYVALRAELETRRPSSARDRAARRSTKAATVTKADKRAPSLTDDEVVALAQSSPSGAAFSKLWKGDTSDYNDDHSSADMAFAGRLAFWTGKDPEQMDSIFRESGLMRPKWDTRRGLGTYGEQTIEIAIANCNETYSGPDKSSETFVENLKRKRAAKVAKAMETGDNIKLGSVAARERSADKPPGTGIPTEAMKRATAKLPPMGTFSDDPTPEPRTAQTMTHPQEVAPSGSEVAPSGSEVAPPETRPISHTADGVMEKPIKWMWKYRIPIGMIGMMDGDPGVGKSSIVANIAAHVTTGALWPDGLPCPKGDVIIVGGEDSDESVVRPRLVAAGADLKRVHLVHLVPNETDNSMRLVRLPDDTDMLTDEIIRTGAKLLVFDPIMPYISGHKNTNSDQDVRQALTPLAMAVDKLGCTVMLLRHLNKQSELQMAMYRGLGSIGFMGLSRWGFTVARVKKTKNPTVFSMAPNKASLSQKAMGFRYTIQQYVYKTEGYDEPIETSHIEWGEEVDEEADDLITPDAGRESPARDNAKELLYKLLEDGPMRADDAVENLKAQGISRTTAYAAQREVGVVATHVGYGPGQYWAWSLPGQDTGPLRGAFGRDAVAVDSVSSAQDSVRAESWQTAQDSADRILDASKRNLGGQKMLAEFKSLEDSLDRRVTESNGILGNSQHTDLSKIPSVSVNREEAA